MQPSRIWRQRSCRKPRAKLKLKPKAKYYKKATRLKYSGMLADYCSRVDLRYTRPEDLGFMVCMGLGYWA